MSIENLEEYIANADLESLDALLTANPQLATTKTSLNVSPLMLACYYKQQAVTNILLKYTTNLTLFEAAAADKNDVVENLINFRPESIDYYADDGFTALGLACYFGRYEIARYLIVKGANVNRIR